MSLLSYQWALRMTRPSASTEPENSSGRRILDQRGYGSSERMVIEPSRSRFLMASAAAVPAMPPPTMTYLMVTTPRSEGGYM